jgi:hypothetical protein
MVPTNGPKKNPLLNNREGQGLNDGHRVNIHATGTLSVPHASIPSLLYSTAWNDTNGCEK